jgi:hypothetical protein
LGKCDAFVWWNGVFAHGVVTTIAAGLPIEGVSGMREIEIREVVRTIAEGDSRYDPAREAVALAVAVVLKDMTKDGDVIVKATDHDVTELLGRPRRVETDEENDSPSRWSN